MKRELESILRQAQERNKALGVTGILIYDQDYFFQWLEGPRHALTSLWASIQHDDRHSEIEIIREQSMQKRFFGAWDMRLARRARGDVDAAMRSMDAPHDLLTQLHMEPSALRSDDWDRLFDGVVVPRLKVTHHQVVERKLSGVERQALLPGCPWHARQETGARLAATLLAVDLGAAADFVDTLIAEGAQLDALFNEVFEPAARCLGGFWDEDDLDDMGLAVGLGRLQVEARRVSASLAGACTCRPGQAVLVAPTPGEPHGLGAAMSSELFWREGWDVSCEYPSSNRLLGKLVHDRWYDVLDLTLSPALRRDQQKDAMNEAIRTAHAASLNPAIAVIVGGRSFFDAPLTYRDVGADAGCATVIDAVPIAQRLLDAATARAAAASSRMFPPRSLGRKTASASGRGRR